MKTRSEFHSPAHQDIYQKIHSAAQENQAHVYLVGGWVRNLILNRPILDIDLLVYGNDTFLKSLRRRLPSTLIRLDPDRKIYRLVPRQSPITIDITFEDPQVPLVENLGARDFTINAMAIKSEDLILPVGHLADLLIDPFHGLQDAAKGLLRMVRAENFNEDPLRLLRAFRFGAECEFKIHADTLEAITRYASKIHQVAPERMHEEWIKMMKCPKTAPYIEQMKETGLLGQIFPDIHAMDGLQQGSRHRLPLWEHSMATLHSLECMFDNPKAHLLNGLVELPEMIQSIYAHQMPYLKMAALFHDIGKPNVKGIGKKGQTTFYGHQHTGATMLESRMDALRFSKKEIRITSRLIRDHMRPLLLFLTKNASDRAKARLFIRLGELWEALLLLSIADMMATTDDEQRIVSYQAFMKSLVLFRNRMERKIRKAPLITGDDLKKEILFPSGPVMGKALRAINQAYLSGIINTRAEALEMAEKYLPKETK